MPSNRSMSPPKRRAHRSASSSSLIAPVVTTAHVRRLSRIPSTTISPSLSNNHLPRLPSHTSFPITPDCEPDAFPPQPLRPPSLSDHPLSIPRLGAAVDALIRPPAKGKPPRPHDPPALLILLAMFLLLFVLLIAVLRSVFPSTIEAARVSNIHRVNDNLDRVARNITPLQFWPLPDSLKRAQQPMPSPIATNLSVSRIWDMRFLAARHVQRPLRLSVVAACKDRTAFLQTALPAWLNMLHPRKDEILLVDWATSTPDYVPLSEVVRATRDKRLSVVTLTHSSPWVLSRAYNLGFSLARGEWLLKLDCDTAVDHTFLNAHPLPTAEDRLFYRFDWANARDRNEEHLNGVFLARTQHVLGVHGYDERITTYGWEDSDLYKRLQAGNVATSTLSSSSPPSSSSSLSSSSSSSSLTSLSSVASSSSLSSLSSLTQVPPLKAVSINRDTIRHMPHDDGLRGAAQHLSMGPLLETQVNSQAADGLPSWSIVGAHEKTTFQLDVLSRDAQFLAATVVQTPSALLELVTSTRRDVIVAEAVSRVLHDTYGIPWASLSELDHSREHVVRVLAAASRGRGADTVIFTVLHGSVAERILGLASSMLFASGHGRPLFLTWGTGCSHSSSSSTSNNDASSVDTACKVADFFDMDDAESQPSSSSSSSSTIQTSINSINGSGSSNSAIAAATHSSTRPVFHLLRWRCNGIVNDCASVDPAYKIIEEWHSEGIVKEDFTDHSVGTTRSSTISSSLSMLQEHIDDVIQGRISGKRNVLLRLNNALPIHSTGQIDFALSSLRPSSNIADYIAKIGDVSQHIGVYIGGSLHTKSIDAVVRRISTSFTTTSSISITSSPTTNNNNNNNNNNNFNNSSFFVTGPNIETVLYARSLLRASSKVGEALQQEIDSLGINAKSKHNHADTLRQIAELMLLGRCKTVLNDGRPSQAVISVIKAFQQSNHHHVKQQQQQQ